ncbi:MAG: oxygenase MpaB family protein [Rhodococcus sp. (in: high G+C Gram-positive bacteria)]|uniref:oxygenase MpaB family protein n=1 Tax=Rhodococcus sp. TaxID=1831 RepID=UPI003BB1A072
MSTSFEVPDRLDQAMDGAGLVAGAANIIMQLAHPGVGYGVYESKVESGQLFRHPIKRSRTTLTYLVVAARGTDEEKALFRKGVNRAHAKVRSTPDSPVQYNAFDPELQLWVAACIYRGFEDVTRALHGELSPEASEYFYKEGATFGTTLQVPEDMWPADREAFEEYWNNALEKVSIDDTIREHVLSIARLEFVHPIISRLVGPMNLFFTRGFLPQRFRDEMRLTWTDKDQRRFDRTMSTVGAVSRRLPAPLREFPYNLLMRDLRRRIKTGRALV